MFAIPAVPLFNIISNIDSYPAEKQADLKSGAIMIFTLGILGMILAVIAIRLLCLMIRYKKRYRLLCNDMKIYE